MEKGRIWQGLAIMLGLVICGAMFPIGVKEFKSYDRTVSVKGLCEREVKADKVIWPIRFKVVGNELAPVYNEIERKNGLIADFLRGGGIDASEITVSSPILSDKFAQEYGNSDRLYRFVATSTVTVCTKDVDKVLALMAGQQQLIRNGISQENEWEARPQFSYESLNDIKPEMIQEATQNAREVALKFAQDSNSKVGKIKNANQGTFTIEDRDSNTPHIKKVRVVTNVVYYLKK